jgi:hypothetical protein
MIGLEMLEETGLVLPAELVWQKLGICSHKKLRRLPPNPGRSASRPRAGLFGGADGLPMDSGGLLRTRGKPSFGLRNLPAKLRETSCVNEYLVDHHYAD